MAIGLILPKLITQEEFQNALKKGLPNLINLKHLCLHNCNLSFLPDEITELQNLEILDISRNSFTHFPAINGHV